MSTLADRLAHVLWIGGAPCAGKTTLSRQLAGKYDLKIYDLDWHYVREDHFNGGPACRWWAAHTMDERWVDISAEELLARSTATWIERFPIALEDIAALPSSRAVVAEGPGVIPSLLRPVLRQASQAIFLLPDLAFRDRVVAEREAAGSALAYGTASDPDRMRANHRERDRRFAERIAGECAELGLRSIPIGSTMDLDAALTVVEEHFRPHLPASLNV